MALMVARPLFPSESPGAWRRADAGRALAAVGGALVCRGGRPAEVFHPLRGRRCGRAGAGRLAHDCRLWAVRNGSPRPAINMLWEWLGMAAGFFLARQLLTTPRELRAAVAVMVALAVGIAGYGVYQWRWEIPQTQAMYKADPEAALRKADLTYAAGSPERTLYDDRVRTAAPMATFALSNSLAAFLSPWLVILAAIAGSHWAGRENRRRLWGILPCCVLIAACLLLTRGRGGCIAALLGLGTLLLLAPILRRRLNWKLPAAAAAVLLAAALAAVAIVWQLDPGAFSRANNVARISLSICPLERSNDCRSSVARVRAGQLPGGVYPVQVA